MKKRMYGILLPATLLVLLCFFLVPFNKQTQTDADTIRIGYHPNFGGASAVFLGMEEGYFSDEGLKVELVSFTSGPPSIAALKAGDIDISFLGHGASSFLLEGDIQVVAVDSLSYAEQLIVRNDSLINSVAGLQGKKVATPFGTSGENFLDMILYMNGIPRENVNVINYDINGAVTAIVSGRVDAVSIWAPYSREIEEAGSGKVKTLVDCRDLKGILYLPMCWVAGEKYIDGNTQAVERFVRALYRSMDYRAEHLNDAAGLVSKNLGIDAHTLQQDLDIAEWLTSASMKEYLTNRSVLKWYRDQHVFFMQKNPYDRAVPVETYLRLDIMEQVLLGGGG